MRCGWGAGSRRTAVSSLVERLTAWVVALTPSRVRATTPAMDAPVSSSTPPVTRNRKMMCDPRSENSWLEPA